MTGAGRIEELASRYLPEYLTPKLKEDLWRELKDFPSNTRYILGHDTGDKILQGDVFDAVKFINIVDSEIRSSKALVLSNSCDVDPENARDTERMISVAPLVSLSAYADLLQKKGIARERVESRVLSIKQQTVSSMFYLPKAAGLGDDMVVLFDRVQSQPDSFFWSHKPSLVARLTQYGFYILLIKLSVHFCRFQENVDRSVAA
ncbi:MAG: hypothetical protein K2R93_08900 [Gemmatimonadaceae bacterium]|nr:hypothetical protein [Gemmatimonadaceae bacterium]